MRAQSFARAFGALLLFSSGLSFAAPAKAPALMVVDAIEPGQWELREIGSMGAPRVMCIVDPETFLQLRHAGAQCPRFVVANQPQTLTVSYSCVGTGNGRTTIALATPRIIRLQTQGIAQNAPFDVEYAARRVGDCLHASR